MATATISKSNQTETFGNAADIIIVTCSKNRIYTKGGKDRITLSKGKNNMIDAGTGNDVIIVSSGNKHTLLGGKGSDKYLVNSKITKSTLLAIDQTGYKKKDADTLQLSKVKMADVYYSLNEGTLTITHANGGKISVSGWTGNPLAKIEFANHQPDLYHSNSVTGKQINNYLALASGNVINVTKTHTYKAVKAKELFQPSGFGWKATIQGADKSDALDLTRYNLEYVDWEGLEKSGNDLCITLVKEGKGSKSSRTASIRVKNYFTSANSLGKIAYYDHGDADYDDVVNISDKTTLCVMNIRYGKNGTKEDDYIQAVKGGKLKGGAGNDYIMGSDEKNTLYGDAGDDLICGGEGNDKLYGGAGNDEIDGDEGDDILHGGPGNDWLSDSEGKNELYGEAGNDLLTVEGNAGHYLKGGKGSDSYFIDYVPSGVAITVDQTGFQKGDKDILNLTHISKDSVDFSLNSGTLTIAADFGGTIDVLGWDVNPLSKIVFEGKDVVLGSDIS
jgi:Ca2+-binding RTX toxin-like protein